jgi:hypothetical protein
MEIKSLYKTRPVIQNTKSSTSNILIVLLGTALLVVSFISIVALVKNDGNESTTFAATGATAATTSANIAINPNTEMLVLSSSINMLLDRIQSLEVQLSERPQQNVRSLQPGMEVLTPHIGEKPRSEDVRPPPQEKKPQAPRESEKPRSEDVRPPPQEKKAQAPHESEKPRSEGVRPPPRENNGSTQGRPPREKQGPPPREKRGAPPREKKGQQRRR